MKNAIEKLKENKNLPLMLFILTGLLSDVILRGLTTKNLLYWKPIVASMGLLLLFSLIPLLLDYRKKRRAFIVLSVLVAMLSAANYLYFKHFNSFISISIIHQIKFVFEMDGSVVSTLDFKVLLFLIPPLGFTLSMMYLKKINYFENVGKRCIRRHFLMPVGAGILCIVMVLVTLTSTDFSRLVKQWNRPYIVEQLGLYSYTLADAVKSIGGTSAAAAQLDEDKADEYIDRLVDANVTERIEVIDISENYKDIFSDRDVYIIHYESAQTFAMDLEFADGNVTPFLNELADEGLSFSNFYPQHSVGTSSDSEFTFNTSLYPINNGTVFMSHSDREFITLQNLLTDKGYFSVSMHGNTGDFWNRNVMHKTLGYDHYFSMSDYVIDEEIGLGLSDKSFFKQSVEKIKDLKDNYDKVVATMITLTNHYPFDDLEKFDEFDVGHLEGTVIGNYLKSYHYADQALESFIEQMDEEGLLENAVLVIYGDHHAQIPMSDYNTLYNYNPITDDYYTEEDSEYLSIDEVRRQKLRRTPFIVWTKDKAIDMEVETPMGMIDALPILGNMLGIFNEYQLGTDVMNSDNNTVVFPDGSWIDEKHYYSASSGKYFNHYGNEIEENPSLLNKTKKTEEDLLLSNEIVNGDLIRTHTKSETDKYLTQ